MKNQVKYDSDIQPPYGISRYKYYEIKKDNDKYYIINDYDTKIYYSEQRIRELYCAEEWDNIFVKENIVDKKVEEKIKKSYKNQDETIKEFNKDKII